VRLRKELHRFAYVAALLVLQHLMLSPFAPKRATLVGATVFTTLWATRFLPLRRTDRAPGTAGTASPADAAEP
jgi:DMSO/TMAO reductase YedYZ heme-binding membrane subunit